MADIRLGNNNTVYKVGSGDCTIYLGTTLLYSGGTPPTPPTPHDYSLDYLTFTALESGTFKFTQNSLDYSLDGGSTWTTLSPNTDSPTVNAGDKILWKASGLTPTVVAGIGKFSSTGKFNVEGNAMSLVFGDNFVGQTDLTGKNYAFYSLFYWCGNLVSAENLVLPATTLAGYGCYASMFAGCTGLTTAPELPATTLAQTCYEAMFQDCTSLTTAPELPATNLSGANYCYRYMFRRCTSLNYIKAMFTTTPSDSYTNSWVSGVASSGTFVKNSAATWNVTGANGVPDNWTVVDYTP